MSNSINHHFTAALLLQDGTFYTGKALGKRGTSTGEICFNTGMTGYQEVFTDPSYAGQTLIMNNCYIGNYGARREDMESDSIKISGLICKNISDQYYRPMADDSLNDYLTKNNLTGISDVDTRALVTHIRSKGSMNCIISSEVTDKAQLQAELDKVPSMEGLELSSKVSTKQLYQAGNPESPYRIAVLDLGIKKNILHCFVERGAFLQVYPAKTTFEEMEKFNPQGYFVSNGPGDPAVMDYGIQTVKKIQDSGKPFFGICLGHQLLALANGIPTFKMHHGHRGLNHPVKNVVTGKSEITTQNHGFGIDPEATKRSDVLEITHVNLNDGSIEGIRLKNRPAFSVQYHPESTPGPYDSRYLFDEFMNMLKMQ
ncbi:MAG: carbamoyl-phosphate synthase small subunit [Chitinophagaceae bacterium]|nr:MAG: carbamoyl-phosphate synthase small subunit [Chitinophagaceae bacterium]